MRKKVIFVLGMHRSGTSAVSGVLARMGAAMPSHLIGPAADNPKGFYESQVVVDLNNSLLSKRRLTSADWREVASSQGHDGETEDEELLIVDALNNEFGDSALICVKDPRLCKLAALWISTAAKFGYEPLVVIPLRNPYEVAGSLRHRDGMTLVNSLLLWMRHVLDAEYYSRSSRRSFVRLDGFMSDWRREVARIGRDLAVEWPRTEAEAATEIESFLDRELIHHSVDEERMAGASVLSKWIANCWNALNGLRTDSDVEENRKILDEHRAKLNESSDIFGKLSQETQIEDLTLKARTEELNSLVDNQRNEISQISNALHMRSEELQTAWAEWEAERNRLSSGLEAAEQGLLARDEELVALRQAIGNYQAQSEAFQGTRDEWEAERDRFTAGLEDARKEILVRDEELTTLRHTIHDRFEPELERLTVLMAERDGVLKELRSRETSATERAAGLEEQVSALKQNIEELVSEKQALASEFSAFTDSQRQHFDADLEAAKAEIEKLNDRLRRQKESFEAALVHAEETAKMERAAGFKTAERQMRVELNASLEEITRLANALEALDIQKQFADRELAVAMARISEQKLAYDAAIAHAQETAKLEHQAGVMLTERRASREVQAVRDQWEKRVRHLDTVTSGLRAAYYGKTLRRRQYLVRLLPFWEKYDTLRTIKYIQASGKFDAAWYRETYPDIAAAGVDPVTHYVLSGASEGRNPNEGFDGTAYLAANPHLFGTGANVFLVYLKQQAYLKDVVRKSGLFDAGWYLQSYPDVGEAGVDPLTHYFEFGAVEGRKPNETFDTAEFIERRPDLDAAYTNPLAAHILSI